jgi:hypothetical protein
MDLKTWCKNQAEQAKIYKWNKGVELGKDPGNDAIVEWVEKYAGDYRKEYKACYDNILKKVENSIKDKASITDEQLHSMTKLIIDAFIIEWTKQEAMDIKHIEEI